jgi:hypothetical protein
MNDTYSNQSKINRKPHKHIAGNPVNAPCSNPAMGCGNPVNAHVPGNPAMGCGDGNPSGLLRSVDNASPIYAHPGRDASPTGCNVGCGMGFLPSEASRRDATTQRHMSGNPATGCGDGNPSGLLRSVDNASPIYVHPGRDASPTGCNVGCGTGFLPSEASRRDATARRHVPGNPSTRTRPNDGAKTRTRHGDPSTWRRLVDFVALLCGAGYVIIFDAGHGIPVEENDCLTPSPSHPARRKPVTAERAPPGCGGGTVRRGIPGGQRTADTRDTPPTPPRPASQTAGRKHFVTDIDRTI